ncbi:uncharacterized protein PADG_00729 [Paracoccidioides brasiliensis Pb18]|uniref:Uncharacterized protein n=1 Tax=Paracoccidioides brasiliensis (strain Pb18) TaxID=502780 RepID=C1G1I9_PARBD|nr:uncharacterized protein PADG_00729 [Paracoccidioides brasiliensis Pb18]EEH44440.2 hypothetical protein PADG_00729 [Paracoccidioides brasiliensis Pb18]
MGATLVRIHESAVLKRGTGVSLAEAQNMKFCSSQVKDTRTCHLRCMGRAAKILQWRRAPFWPTLSDHARDSIHAQLAEFLRQLHAIKMEKPGLVGSGVFHSTHSSLITAPAQQMESWFNERLLVCKEFNRVPYSHP